jgi:hypothetical protein
MRIASWLVLSALAAAPVYGFESSFETWQKLKGRFPKLDERFHKTTLGTDEGQRFYRTFLDEAAIIRKCIPPDPQIAQPATMYVEVKKDGHIGQLEFYPQTETTKCVVELLRNHVFPKPTHDYVAGLFLSLTPTIGDVFVGITYNPFAVPNIPSARHIPCFLLQHGSAETSEQEDQIIFHLYVCSQSDPQKFVLWWFGRGGQLVREYVFPTKTFARGIKRDKKTGLPLYNLYFSNECRSERKAVSVF